MDAIFSALAMSSIFWAENPAVACAICRNTSGADFRKEGVSSVFTVKRTIKAASGMAAFDTDNLESPELMSFRL